MHIIRIAGGALAAGALLVACAEQPIPTEGPAVDSPLFSFSNNPDNGNPRILRFNNLATFLIVDDETNLFSLQAGRDAPFNFNAGERCGEVTALSFEDVQRILHDPDDPVSAMINETRQGRDIFIHVFQGPFSEVTDCDDMLSRLLAQGRGNFTNTDNDVLIFLRPHNNVNAFGFTAHSNDLELIGGGRAMYNGVSKCVWDGNDLGTLMCVDKINFH